MDNELKEALSALLKAELLPIFNEIGGLNDQLGSISARLDGMDHRLEGMDTRLEGMDTRLEGIDTRLEGIDTRLDGVDTRLDSVDKRLHTLELEQTQIKQAVLETNATVKRIELIQEQQHSIIELLSARSIEHEAKIKRIL